MGEKLQSPKGASNYHPDPHCLLTAFCFSSLEDAMPLFPNLLGTSSSPRVEFYDRFQREADEHDRDLMKKYDEDSSTTLIFVSLGLVFVSATAFILFTGVYRPIRSQQLLPLSSSMPRTTSNRTFKKSATTSSGLLPISRQGTIQPAQLLLSLNGRPRPHRGPHTIHPLLYYGRLPPRCVRCDAGQAMAQPLLSGRNARIPYRPQSSST